MVSGTPSNLLLLLVSCFCSQKGTPHGEGVLLRSCSGIELLGVALAVLALETASLGFSSFCEAATPLRSGGFSILSSSSKTWHMKLHSSLLDL